MLCLLLLMLLLPLHLLVLLLLLMPRNCYRMWGKPKAIRIGLYQYPWCETGQGRTYRTLVKSHQGLNNALPRLR